MRRQLDAADDVLLAKAERRGADVHRHAVPEVGSAERDAGGPAVARPERVGRRAVGDPCPGHDGRVGPETPEIEGVVRIQPSAFQVHRLGAPPLVRRGPGSGAVPSAPPPYSVNRSSPCEPERLRNVPFTMRREAASSFTSAS